MFYNPVKLCLIISMYLNLAHGTSIKFYEKSIYEGFLFESNSASSCTNILPSYNLTKGSIKTDTCLMIYSGEDCTNFSSKVVSPGQNFFWDWQSHLGVHSYHACNDNEGGPQLNVDFYNGFYLNGSIVASYNDICGCKNLPQDLHRLRMSVNNHGNPMVVYTRKNCEGEDKVINAGRNGESDNINKFIIDRGTDYEDYETHYDILSFSPHTSDYPKHCFKLYSKIYKIECLDSIQESEPIITENMELTEKTVFTNNQSEKLTQEYSVSKKIRETVELQAYSGSEIESMDKVKIDPNVEVIANIPFIEKSKFIKYLKAAYKVARTNTSVGGKEAPIIVESEREISVNQLVEVPPCTEYTHQGFVKIRKNKLIECKIYSNITGKYGKKAMNKYQIRDHLEKFTNWRNGVFNGVNVYNSGSDYMTAESRGKFKMEFGINSIITGDRKRITDCQNKKMVDAISADDGLNSSANCQDVDQAHANLENTLKNFSFQCKTEERLVDPSVSVQLLNMTSDGLPVKVEYQNYGTIEQEKAQLVCKEVAGLKEGQYLCETNQFGSSPASSSDG